MNISIPTAPLIELPPHATGAIVFADGTIFFGQGAGAEGIAGGEICFNTAMTGYQEILTDPSYMGQIITFTFPEIGITGTNEEDKESMAPAAKGCILRNSITAPSSWRATLSFNEWLIQKELVAITHVDTRAITHYIRQNGAQNVAIIHDKKGHIKADILMQMARSLPPLKNADLATQISRKNAQNWQESLWQLGQGYQKNSQEKAHIVAIDFGAKDNILRHLKAQGCQISLVPAQTTVEEILALKPHGIFLSNGPGDPAATAVYVAPVIQALIAANLPIFGICLGHQLLAIALGAQTQKMTFGHRGANHPVRHNLRNHIEITSQNHGFMVMRESLPGHIIETHTSLFDDTIEGIALKDKPVFSVQYHPEASPGPHDSLYLFEQFAQAAHQYAQNKGE